LLWTPDGARAEQAFPRIEGEEAAVVEEDSAGGAAEEGVSRAKLKRASELGRRSNTVRSSPLVR
jgi:hypothetical protein